MTSPSTTPRTREPARHRRPRPVQARDHSQLTTTVLAVAGWVIVAALVLGALGPTFAAAALAVCLLVAIAARGTAAPTSTIAATPAPSAPAAPERSPAARSGYREIELAGVATDLARSADASALVEEAAARIAQVFDARWVEILTADGMHASFESEESDDSGTSISVSLPTDAGDGHLALEAHTGEGIAEIRDDLHRAAILVGDALERVRVRELLGEAQEHAERTERAKREFLANTSHELRTPLNGILGSAELLAGTELDASQRELVETVLGCSESLLSLMQDVLELASLDAGSVSIESEAFDPIECVELVAAGARERVRAGVEVSAAWSPVLESGLIGAQAGIQRSLRRLAENAAAFTTTGRITISATALDHGRRDDGRLRVRFAVEDTGPGIAPHRRDAIFERFSQADGRTTRPHEGAGLGLAIATELVSTMGSTIELESEVGSGSTFAFVLDLEVGGGAAVPRDASVPVDAAAPRAASSIRRILVVDDNPVNLRVARRILERKGIVVEEATNGLEAVERALFGSFDLVLMDIQMPTMDGIEATKSLLLGWRRESRPPSPIVALTAHTMDEHRWRCLDAGMADFLAKPLDAEALDAVLERLGDPHLGAA